MCLRPGHAQDALKFMNGHVLPGAKKGLLVKFAEDHHRRLQRQEQGQVGLVRQCRLPRPHNNQMRRSAFSFEGSPRKFGRRKCQICGECCMQYSSASVRSHHYRCIAIYSRYVHVRCVKSCSNPAVPIRDNLLKNQIVCNQNGTALLLINGLGTVSRF